MVVNPGVSVSQLTFSSSSNTTIYNITQNQPFLIFSSGGANNNYSSNENITYNFTNNTSQDLKINFFNFYTDPNDILTINGTPISGYSFPSALTINSSSTSFQINFTSQQNSPTYSGFIFLIEVSNPPYTRQQLLSTLTNLIFLPSQLKNYGFTATEMKTQGFTAKQMLNANYSVSELYLGGFTAGDVIIAGQNYTQSVNGEFIGDHFFNEIVSAGYAQSQMSNPSWPVDNNGNPIKPTYLVVYGNGTTNPYNVIFLSGTHYIGLPEIPRGNDIAMIYHTTAVQLVAQYAYAGKYVSKAFIVSPYTGYVFRALYGLNTLLVLPDQRYISDAVNRINIYNSAAATGGTIYSLVQLRNLIGIADSTLINSYFTISDLLDANITLQKMIDAGRIEPNITFAVVNSDRTTQFYTESTVSNYFAGNTNITNVYLTNKVKKIASGAFSGCTNLKRINIPDSVTSIGTRAFTGCSSLNIFVVNQHNSSLIQNIQSADGDFLSIYEIINLIGSIGFSPTLAQIVNYGFSILDLLNNGVSFDDLINNYAIPNNSAYLIEYNDGTLSIQTGSSISSLSENTSIKNVFISSYITSISSNAFNGCTGITNIVLSNSVTSIGSNAFSGCLKLKSIRIPNSVTSIGSNAFSNCPELLFFIIDPTNRTLINLITQAGGVYTSVTQLLLNIDQPGITYTYDDILNAGYDAYQLKINNLSLTDLVSHGYKPSTLLEGTYTIYDLISVGVTSSDTTYAVVLTNGITLFYNDIGVMKNFSNNNMVQSAYITKKITQMGSFSGCSNLKTIYVDPDATIYMGFYVFAFSGLRVLYVPDNTTFDTRYIGASVNTFTYSNISIFVLNETNVNLINRIIVARNGGGFLSLTQLKSAVGQPGVWWTNYDLIRAGWSNSDYFGAGYTISELIKYKNPSASFATISLDGSINFYTGTTISSNQVSGNENIVSVIVTNNVTSIGQNAFANCENLSSISIDNSVNNIGQNAFANCPNLYFFITDETNTHLINLIKNSGGNYKSLLSLKSSVGKIGINFTSQQILSAGYPLLSLFQVNFTIDQLISANYINSNVTGAIINLDGTINYINETSLKTSYIGNTNIKNVYLTSKVTSIDRNIFSGCINLQLIQIPNSVKSIGTNAFNGCISLNYYVIDQINTSLINLIKNAGGNFLSLKTLKSMTGSSGITENGILTAGFSAIDLVQTGSNISELNTFGGYIAGDFLYALCTFDQLIPLNFTTSSTSYAVVDNKGYATFYTGSVVQSFQNNTNIIRAYISSKVTSIVSNAFNGCINLYSIQINNIYSNPTIGSNAFLGTNITFYVIDQDDDSLAARIQQASGSYKSLISLKNALGQNGTTYIKSDILRAGYSIASAKNAGFTPKDLADSGYSLPAILAGGFTPSLLLTSGYFSVSDLIINNVFPNDTSYVLIISDGIDALPQTGEIASNITNPQIDITTITGVYFTNLVTSIADNGFNGCINLLSPLLPNSLTNIGVNAFLNCSNITTMTIPNSVTIIGNAAFSQSGITSIVLPTGLKNITNSMFYSCNNLKSISLPTGLTNISLFGFRQCTSLTNIVIPNSVTSIDEGAFQNCTNLTSVTLPSNITSISDSLFSGCINLPNISLPLTITNIGIQSFNNCKNIKMINIPDSVISIGNNAFNECQNLIIYVINQGYSTTNNANINSRLVSLITAAGGYYFSLQSLVDNLHGSNGNNLVYYNKNTLMYVYYTKDMLLNSVYSALDLYKTGLNTQSVTALVGAGLTDTEIAQTTGLPLSALVPLLIEAGYTGDKPTTAQSLINSLVYFKPSNISVNQNIVFTTNGINQLNSSVNTKINNTSSNAISIQGSAL